MVGIQSSFEKNENNFKFFLIKKIKLFITNFMF